MGELNYLTEVVGGFQDLFIPRFSLKMLEPTGTSKNSVQIESSSVCNFCSLQLCLLAHFFVQLGKYWGGWITLESSR